MKVSEIFHSIQGEGKDIGLPTTFVRTSGCNLRCEWCDTKYAWEGGKEIKVERIKKKLEEIGCQRICITGGEPLLQDDVYELIDLIEDRYKVSVETNGSIDVEKLVGRDVRVSMDYKVLSSNMYDEMLDRNLDFLREKDQLKFVILDKEDFEFSRSILENYDLNCEIIFQAVDNENLKDLAGWVMEDGLNVRVLPQLHKVIWGDEKGV